MKFLKFLKNVYSHKKYILFLCFLLTTICIFSGSAIQHEKSTKKEENKEMLNQNNEPFNMQELYAVRDGKRIYGELYLPQNISGKLPVVIYSHGFGGTHAYGVEYAKELVKLGYIVYCFDFCGGSSSSKSDGSTLEMSIFTEQADLEAVIMMIQELDFVDTHNIFLLGSSQGGVVSAITAAKNQSIIRGYYSSLSGICVSR